MQIAQLAALAANNVYADNTDLGTVEFKLTMVSFRACRLQVLAFAGTNEVGDWVSNFSLWSSQGIKQSAFNAATTVHSVVSLEPGVPLIVTGHSKGGAEAIAYHKLFGATWCVAFCPARCLRYWCRKTMYDTTIFIDPDDPVPKLACLSFRHPICNTVYLPDDVPGLWLGEHSMKNIMEYLK